MIFDSHAHYIDDAFNEDRKEVIENLKKENVGAVLNCACTLEEMIETVELSKEYDFIYSAIGVHPSSADTFEDSQIEKMRELSKEKMVKAIGEIGLDYYWDDNPDRVIQRNVFRKQMSLAKELSLPVVIHDREAHEDTLNIIKEFPAVTGVVHCFSGSAEFAQECIKRGYYIGITGVITFNNAKKLKKVVDEIPMDKLLIETDCPYMAPVPFRGKRNDSRLLKYIIETIAEIKGITPEEVEQITYDNACELFNIN